MTQNTSDFSSYSAHQLAFESIGDSAWQSLSRLIKNRLAAAVLVGYYHSVAPACADELQEDSIHNFLEDNRRHALLGAIGILDSFLSDCLRFLFLFRPNTIPREAAKKKLFEHDYSKYVERVVRSGYFQKQINRIDFLASEFNLTLDPTLRSELLNLTALRNEISHHSGFYRFVVDPGSGILLSEDKPLPHVSESEARIAPVIVGRVCNSVYDAMSKGLFGAIPLVCPVNRELAELYEKRHEDWLRERNHSPLIEEFPDPGWSMRVLSNPSMPWVGDEFDAWVIIPSGIAQLPPSVSFSWNDRHGMKAWAVVDNGPRDEIKDYSRDLLDRMLAGNSIVVEYYGKMHDGPKFARFSLSGFPEAWAAACQRKKETKGA